MKKYYCDTCRKFIITKDNEKVVEIHALDFDNEKHEGNPYNSRIFPVDEKDWDLSVDRWLEKKKQEFDIENLNPHTIILGLWELLAYRIKDKDKETIDGLYDGGLSNLEDARYYLEYHNLIDKKGKPL